MKLPKFTLISHHLCPYVQRAAILMHEHGVPFERRDIDLANKPDWFLQLSPLGKVPVLLVDDDVVLFESTVIAQYVNEVTNAGMLSSEPLEKHRQLAWVEFASQLIADIGRLYLAGDQAAVDTARQNIAARFLRLEQILNDGPWFANEQMTLVDAAFAPAFRYFDVIEGLTSFDFFAGTPKVARWRTALAERPSVIQAVSSDYAERLLSFLADRDSVVGKIATTELAAQSAAA